MIAPDLFGGSENTRARLVDVYVSHSTVCEEAAEFVRKLVAT